MLNLKYVLLCLLVLIYLLMLLLIILFVFIVLLLIVWLLLLRKNMCIYLPILLFMTLKVIYYCLLVNVRVIVNYWRFLMSQFSYTPPLFGEDDNLLEVKTVGKKVICTFQISYTQLKHLKNVSDYQKVTVSALIRSALDHFIFKGLK